MGLQRRELEQGQLPGPGDHPVQPDQFQRRHHCRTGQAIQWSDNGGSPQQWTVTGLEHGYYKLVSVRSGKVLDDDGSTADGAALVQRTVSGGQQQQWAVSALGGGAYRLTNRHSGKALDNANTTAEGDPVIQWSVNGGTPLTWTLTKLG